MAANLLSIDFKAGQGEWTINDVNKDTLGYVWAQDSRYGMKASAYVKAAHATESWLISPAIDLSGVSASNMIISHAMNKGSKANLAVKASVDGENWSDVELSAWPAGTDWNFIEATADLKAFVGNAAVKIAFVYKSTTSDCPTWEIESVAVNDGEAVVPVDPETPDLPEGVLSCAQAVEAAAAIEDPAEEKATVEGEAITVRGYVTFAYDAKNGKQSAWLSDTKGAKSGEIQGAYLEITDAVVVGDYVECVGTLAKYKKAGKDGAEGEVIIEVINGTMSKLDENGDPVDPETPDLPEGVISCAQAVEAAAAIEDPAEEKATVEGNAVKVRGYVTFAYDAKNGKQSAWLSDTKGAKAGVIQGAYLEITEAVVVGDYVECVGTLAKYKKAGKDGAEGEVIIEIINGTMNKVSMQGIEEVVMTEKAQKVLVDGVIYIVRDNKMYNLQGAQVR